MTDEPILHEKVRRLAKLILELTDKDRQELRYVIEIEKKLCWSCLHEDCIC